MNSPQVTRLHHCQVNRKYRPSDKQKPDPVAAKASKRLASRFYQFKPDRSIPGVHHTAPRRHLLVVSVQHPDTGAPV